MYVYSEMPLIDVYEKLTNGQKYYQRDVFKNWKRYRLEKPQREN